MSQTPPTEPATPDSEAIRVLLREALSELQRDHLKQELLKEIRAEERKVSFGKVAGHPAFLLFIGFILTGIIGTLLTTLWQSREWDRQQKRLIQIKRIEQKEKFTEELTQAVADSNETEENVLIAFSQEWRRGDPRRDDITKERLEAWRKQGGRDWRIATALIRGKLKVYFTGKSKADLLSIFERVLVRRDDIAKDITDLESQYKKNKNVRANSVFIQHKEHVAGLIEENRVALEGMIEIILEDIQRDVEAPDTLGRDRPPWPNLWHVPI